MPERDSQLDRRADIIIMSARLFVWLCRLSRSGIV